MQETHEAVLRQVFTRKNICVEASDSLYKQDASTATGFVRASPASWELHMRATKLKD